MKNPSPIIGIVCDREIIGPHPFHIVGEKYIKAISDIVQGIPILIPAINNNDEFDQLSETLDGILLTGGYSMVDSSFYQEQVLPNTKLDRQRDDTSFSIIKHSLEKKIPLLGICRGFQELNVALGGSLHQQLHENGNFIEHRENKNLSLEQQYGESHSINLTKSGILEEIIGKSTTEVNSLHTQGINRLSDKLTIEATAQDGLIEAVSVTDCEHFALAVQWHPEWKIDENEDSLNLFKAFSEACKLRSTQRHS